MIKISLDDAIQNAREPGARWPSRDTANRMEPECWPTLKPGFLLKPGQSVFTIGSCFARHIDSQLDALGFDVPVLNFQKEMRDKTDVNLAEVVNKYNPGSIYQEIRWAKDILDRDGKAVPQDFEQFYLHTGKDRVMDLQRLHTDRGGYSRETADMLRHAFFDLYAKLFECDACIITLGLTEAWYDNETESYIEFNAALKRHASPGRFELRRMGLTECHDYVRRTVELISAVRDDMKIVLTTSPVPFSRTFSGDDAIIANMQSKATLRAIAGEVAHEYANVDYFPSFESVMLTKQPYVWDDDLIHVNPTFVSKVMIRFARNYTETGALAAEALDRTEMYKEIRLLRRQGRAAEARALLGDVAPSDVPQGELLSVAMLIRGTDGVEAVTPYIDIWLANRADTNIHMGWIYAAEMFDQTGRADTAAALREELLGEIRKRPGLAAMQFKSRTPAGQRLNDWLVAELSQSDDPELRLLCARYLHGSMLHLLRNDDFKAAAEMEARAVALAPGDALIGASHDALQEGHIPVWLQRAVNGGAETAQGKGA